MSSTTSVVVVANITAPCGISGSTVDGVGIGSYRRSPNHPTFSSLMAYLATNIITVLLCLLALWAIPPQMQSPTLKALYPSAP